MQVGHPVCVESLETYSRVQAKKEMQLDLRELSDMVRDASAPPAGEVVVADEAVEYGFQTLRDFYFHIREFLRKINHPPFACMSKWSPTDSNRLLKRCHKKHCCGVDRSAYALQPRHPFKLGQMDSSDYFSNLCNQNKKFRSTQSTNPAPWDRSRSQELIVATNARFEELHKLGLDWDAKEVGQASLSDSKSKKPASCPGCLLPLEPYDAVQWGGREWVHERCHSGAYSFLLPSLPGDPWREMYELRHRSNDLFDSLLKRKVPSHLKPALMETLRTRVCHLLEQCLVQARFCDQKDAVDAELQGLLQPFQEFDEEGMKSVWLCYQEFDRPEQKQWKRKRRPRKTLGAPPKLGQ